MLGAASLLSGCAGGSGSSWHAGAAGAVPAPTPSVDPSWVIPAVKPPVPDTCPVTSAGAQHAGGPQLYLPCHGTDVALTIDDGPDPQYTPKILALLAKHRVTATFCMIGRQAARYPKLVAAVHDGGHQLANHTQSHPADLAKLPAGKVRDEIAKAGDAIAKGSGGTRPALFRAPGGAWSQTVLAECSAQQIRPLDWSVDPRDWSQPGVEQIVKVILTKTVPGAIILEHDGGGSRDQTVDALAIALPRLLDAGYRFANP
ncbi:polysaccharide deacetylase family protein [Dactylosporangium sp. NPDC049140]|uniref:polysaccharide deacetylase family protein n=1 Tax=Dactylosporangium sp. NPDC049140 TaxID=3155647 RepID=UPI0033FB7B52